jgi:hypothetical protein
MASYFLLLRFHVFFNAYRSGGAEENIMAEVQISEGDSKKTNRGVM